MLHEQRISLVQQQQSLHHNDSIGEGSLILISHVSNLDEMQELLSELVTMLDWEEFKYSVVV